MVESGPTRLVVLFGGPSSEHEISLRSAQSVLDALDRDRFTPIPVGIRRDRQWRVGTEGQALEAILSEGEPVTELASLQPDLVFPVLHGPFGEDGTVQGMLEGLGLPYVGSGVLASSVCMDKAMQKHVIASAAPGIPLVPWVEVDLRFGSPEQAGVLHRVERELGFPCFCKPANLGSSVGVAKCHNPAELREALADAGRYDHKLVVERGVDAREIEVAVLGDGGPTTLASAPGEIGLPEGVWYDYETKYEKDVATYHIPASLPGDLAAQIKSLALQAFAVTGCDGLARIDFFVDRQTGTPYLNELNTMPGFTSISMYPKLIEHMGLPYSALLTRLCELGLARHRARTALRVQR